MTAERDPEETMGPTDEPAEGEEDRPVADTTGEVLSGDETGDPLFPDEA